MSGVHDVVYLNNIEALKSALHRPATDVNARNKSNATALMLAGWRGHVTCARLLIEHGADVNLQNEDGNSALSWAIARGHIGMVQLLVDNGADLDQKPNGKTFLELAERHQEITHILQAAVEKRKAAQLIAIAERQRRLNERARRAKKPWGLS